MATDTKDDRETGNRLALLGADVARLVEHVNKLSAELEAARNERDAARQESGRWRVALDERDVRANGVERAIGVLGVENERLTRALDTSRDELARACQEIERLRREYVSDTYRVPVSVVDDLRAENLRLAARIETERQHAGALAKSGAELNAIVSELRSRAAVLSRALNALVREAKVFRELVSWSFMRGTHPRTDRFDAALNAALAVNPDRPPLLDDLAAFFDAKTVWSEETFGPGDRYDGVIKHIEKELKEIRAKPDDLVEWIDVVLLAMDGAWRSAGANGTRFVEALLAKDKTNRARKWPDWRTLAPGDVSEHVKPQATQEEFPVGTEVSFMEGRCKGTIVGPSDEPGFGVGWYKVDQHEPTVPGGPTRIQVHRHSMTAVRRNDATDALKPT